MVALVAPAVPLLSLPARSVTIYVNINLAWASRRFKANHNSKGRDFLGGLPL